MSYYKLPKILKSLPQAEDRNIKTAKIASIFCPGLGQLMEGKYVKGVIQLVVFVLSITIPMVILFRLLISIVENVVKGNSWVYAHEAISQSIPWGILLSCILMAISIGIWSVWDAGQSR